MIERGCRVVLLGDEACLPSPSMFAASPPEKDGRSSNPCAAKWVYVGFLRAKDQRDITLSVQRLSISEALGYPSLTKLWLGQLPHAQDADGLTRYLHR